MRKHFFPALSSVCCAAATTFMPFVCAGSTRAVSITAFFRERHNDICVLACKITQLGNSAFGKHAEGEPDSPGQWESRGEDGFVSYERPCRMVGVCRCDLKHSSACHSPRGDQPAPLVLAAGLAEIQRCEINEAFSQQNTGNNRG